MLKFVGAIIGFARFGFFGGMIGMIAGSFLDNLFNRNSPKNPQSRFRNSGKTIDFASSFLVLSAVVMRADGKLLKSELEVIKGFFELNFGKEKTPGYMLELKELLNKQIDLGPVCSQIRYSMQHPMRLQLLKYLFEIANADGEVARSEVNVIFEISKYIGISYRDYESIQAMYYKTQRSSSDYNRSSNNTNSSDNYGYNPYKILGIKKTATDAEVKKAYRAMARKHHPDTVSSLGEAHVEKAKEKFIMIDDAYQYIKKRRGIK